MKVMVIGSCLSNLAANYLETIYGFSRPLVVHHNRSDQLVDYFIDKNKILGEAYFETDEFGNSVESYWLYKNTKYTYIYGFN